MCIRDRIDEAGSLGEASKSGGADAGDGIVPGASGWVTVTLASGQYELVCNLPRHYSAGSARFTNAKTNSERTLNMARLSASTETNLNNQGFGKLDEDTKSRVALPLRFTPAVATALIVIGLVLQSPIWLGSMALVAFSGALLPRAMIIDLVYNLSLIHISEPT